jgi:hypothetical protein
MPPADAPPGSTSGGILPFTQQQRRPTPADVLALIETPAQAQSRQFLNFIGQMVAPHLTSWDYLATPPPPPSALPDTPGKVPPADPLDPRLVGVTSDLVNLAMMGFPIGGEALGARTGVSALTRPGLLPGAHIAGKEIEQAIPRALESKSELIYNPPARQARPFSADYPRGVRADEAGRLITDIEGRPLVAERIVGRRTLGGADETLSPAELDAVATAATRNKPQAVASREIRGDAGRFSVKRDGEGRPVYQSSSTKR